MLLSYKTEEITHPEVEKAFIAHTDWCSKKPYPLIVSNGKYLEDKLMSDKVFKGITATAGGFYGPQGRVLRLALQDAELNKKIDSFNHNGNRITNLEMETSAIYGLSTLLGHNAASMNAIIANRANGTFSESPGKVVADLIKYTLDKLVK
jgi:uridine phosphorylase